MNERWVSAEALAGAAGDLVDRGARWLTYVVSDERRQDGGFTVRAVLLEAGGGTVSLNARLDGDAPAYPAITRRVPAAQWDEREAADLFGIVPLNHPDPRRLVMRQSWPAGHYPLRKDFESASAPAFGRDDDFQALVVEGAEITQIPVGPIHAGIIEPGHFRFSAVGETILNLDAQLFYTHRGLEKRIEGMPPAKALLVAERICGACTVSHAAATSMAFEQIAEIELPARAVWGRTLLLELERLYNHLGDAGNMCSGGAYVVGTMTGAILKEQVQRQIESLVGHRFGRSAIGLGGLRRDLPTDGLAEIVAALPAWRVETERFRDLVLSSENMVDRMRRSGVLRPDLVNALGGVGVLARASGVSTDMRRDRPYLGYTVLPLAIPIQTAGDAEARFLQRLDEAKETLFLLERLLGDPPTGVTRAAHLPDRWPAGVGLGVIESPRGANVHWLRVDQAGLVDRIRVRSASFPNWAIVPRSVPGNLVPDFPIINKSFELCYSCLDR
jgi:Ni,Fe-hydrogenase III large subunit/Ni,Fe-hydrogenase III component G